MIGDWLVCFVSVVEMRVKIIVMAFFFFSSSLFDGGFNGWCVEIVTQFLFSIAFPIPVCLAVVMDGV